MNDNWLDATRFAVLGCGRSGVAVANLLARRGKTVLVSDLREEAALSEQWEKLEPSVDRIAGGNQLGDAEVVVLSPGLRPGLAIIEKARRRGLDLVSEVDIAFDASTAEWVGITGTDGKTTTTSLVGAMIAESGRQCVVAGNIGTALSDVVESVGPQAVIVAELSANQLWSCHHLRVETAAITNIAEDHLDYFEDFRDYWEAKYRLVHLQQGRGTVVLPASQSRLWRDLEDVMPQKAIGFDARRDPEMECSVFFDEEGVGRWRLRGKSGVWFDDFSEAQLLGPHNQLNAACAAAVAQKMGASWDDCARGLESFTSLPHRMEVVTQVEGIRYIDDSKATNAHASMAGLSGIEPPLVVIAGGRDKGLGLEQWSREVAQRAELVILIGEATERMAAALSEQGGKTETAETLSDAVELAHRQSRPGTTVVLSPACSSYDMFSSYRERGRCFQKAVHRLPVG